MMRSMLLGAACAVVACTHAAVAQTAGLQPERLLSRDAAASVPHGVPLAWHADPYTTLAGRDELVLTGFPLTASLAVDLELEQAAVLDPAAEVRVGRRTAAAPPVATFRGRITGEPGSTVFLAVSPWATNGFIRRGAAEYIISSGPYGAGLPTVVYDLATLPDGVIAWNPFDCRADELLGGAAPEPGAPGGFRDSPTCRVMDVAIDTDQQFTGLFGGDAGAAAAYATTLVGAVSEIYSRDMNMTFNIVFLRLWPADPNDPWTEPDTISQLFQFRDYWLTNHADIAKTSAHLLSGRSLGGGVAWRPGVCYDNYEYAVSANLNGFFPYPLQHNSPQNWDMMVTAHEWGHIHGAPHTHSQVPQIDDCAGGDCSVAPNGTIMSYCHQCDGGLANVRLEFHPQTVDSYILPHMDDPNTAARCGATDCPDPLPGDLNGDGAVDLDDLLLLLGSFGCTGPGCAGDADGDFDVDLDDLLLLLANFGA